MFGMSKVWASIRKLSEDIEDIWGTLAKRTSNHAVLSERVDQLAVRVDAHFQQLVALFNNDADQQAPSDPFAGWSDASIDNLFKDAQTKPKPKKKTPAKKKTKSRK